MAAESVSVTAPCAHRAPWKTLGFAVAGVCFSSLIFTGLVGAFKEETLLHFAFVLIILVVASLVLLDRIAELALGHHGPERVENAADRARLLVWTIGVAVLIVFLHRSIEAALKDDAQAIGQMVASGLLSSCVTAAWLFGARKRPRPRAARYGALAGIFVGGILGLMIAAFIFFVSDVPGVSTTPPPGLAPIGQIVYRVIMVLFLAGIVPLLWGSFGFMGGLAIDRRWGSSPTRGVLFSLSLLAFPLSFGLFAYSYLHLHTWDPESLRIAFVAVGWGMGLILHNDVCDFTLDVPSKAEVDSFGVPAPVTSSERHKASPVWEGLLIGGLSLIILLLWHQTVQVKFFESDAAVPSMPARKYQTKFAQGSARLINFELDIPKKMIPSGEYELEEVWTGPFGAVPKSDPASEKEEHPVGRFGWIDPGHWPAGTYSVELRVKKPGESNPKAEPAFGPFSFEIVNIGAMPPQEASQQEPQRNVIGTDLFPKHSNQLQPGQSREPLQPIPSVDRSSQVPFQKPKQVSAVEHIPDSPQNPVRRPAPAEPQPVPMEAFMQNARTALASGRLIAPQNDNALYWVRRAKQISPQDLAANQIEQMILAEGIKIVERKHKAQHYDDALSLLNTLQPLYPDHSELGRLRMKIYVEQEQKQYQKARSQY